MLAGKRQDLRVVLPFIRNDLAYCSVSSQKVRQSRKSRTCRVTVCTLGQRASVCTLGQHYWSWSLGALLENYDRFGGSHTGIPKLNQPAARLSNTYVTPKFYTSQKVVVASRQARLHPAQTAICRRARMPEWLLYDGCVHAASGCGVGWWWCVCVCVGGGGHWLLWTRYTGLLVAQDTS